MDTKADVGEVVRHKVERYSCSRCKYHTISKRQLQRHIKQKHSPGKYVCGECGEKFLRPLMFKLHMTTHTNDNEHACPICKKTFPLVSMLKIHQETHSTESIHPCPHCSKQFRQKSALSKHVAFGHTKKNVHLCGICGKIFPSPSTLVLHMDSSHKNMKAGFKKPMGEGGGGSGLGPMTRRLRFYRRPNDQNMFKCQRCQRKFFTSYALAKHMEGHHGFQSHKCIECNLDFKTKKALYRHTAMHVHECEECEKKFRTQEQLETHKKLHSRTELTCTMCGRNFSKGISYRRHMDAHAHNPKYQCPECGKNFRRQADLQTHQWLHKGDGFPCEDCGKKFGTKQHLIWHSYIHYSGKKSDGDIKQERSETDETETEVKTEKVSASGSESNTQNATPKKIIKKEKAKTPTNNKKDIAEDKESDKERDKKKEKRQTPSPVKKNGLASDSKQPESSEGQEKKSGGKQDVKVEEFKIKKERVEENRAKSIENNEKKLSPSTAKPAKIIKKPSKRKSKGKRKSRKPNVKGSEEPTATDTDSKVATGTESEKDAQVDKEESEKVMTTEEVLLSNEVLQESNELHDEKELRVDTVMFDDIEDDVELDINAAIETLTKLGSHTEHEVPHETYGEVEIIEEELEQADKDINEDDLVGLEDIANIDTTDKAISRVDIQSLYDMETDNDTAGETEALDVAKATVFHAMQATVEQATHNEINNIVADDQVISDTSTAMLIESEIVTHANRLIQTGLYVQNVMGAQDCNTVLEAIETAVQQGELIDPEAAANENPPGEMATANLTQQVLDASNVVAVDLVPTPTEAQLSQAELLGNSAPGGTCEGGVMPQCDTAETTLSVDMLQEACIDDPNSALAPVSCEDTCNSNIDAGTAVESQVLVVNTSRKDGPMERDNGSLNEPNEQCVETVTVTNDESVTEVIEAIKSASDMPIVCEPVPEQTKCVSGSYIVKVETVSHSDVRDKMNVQPTCAENKVGEDGRVLELGHCNHMDIADAEHLCVGGCYKCSAEFGLSINKTVCPHSKELKVLIEKLDFKECPVGDNGEVLLSVANNGAEPPKPGQKRRRTGSSEQPVPPVVPTDVITDDDVPVTRTQNKQTVGMLRLRRRIRHSTGTKNVSTKSCDTRRKESQLSGESAVAEHEPELALPSSLTVTTRSTRSCSSRLPTRPLRTVHTSQQQPVKDWRKSPPSAERKHGRKFTSVLRRKSVSDQLSPTPQYTVSALNDLTIRITTQSSPETSPSQQKKSPGVKDSSSKGSRSHEKEDSAQRHAYGATQELCVVLDDINELVLLQKERLRRLKNCKPVKLGRRVDDLKRRHRSNDLSPEIAAPKPIKILLRLPKERIRKHEKRLALLDRRVSYNGTSADVNESLEYQQPDSSQDMLNKARLQLPESVTTHKPKNVRLQNTVVDAVSKAVTDNVQPVDNTDRGVPREEVSLSRRVIGSVVSLSNSVLSVEECDSTSMAETQRQASAVLVSSPGEAPTSQTGTRKKAPSPTKEEPLDLTIRYKELSNMKVKPDPDRQELKNADGDETDVDADDGDDYCTCEDEACKDGPKKGGHGRKGSSGTSSAKVKVDPERGGANGGGERCTVDFTSADAPKVNYAGSSVPLAPDATQTQEAEQESETPTEYIEVVDRGIQCELGDELLFMPQVPQSITD